MALILIIAGIACIVMSFIFFILYLTMGKAVGKKMMKKLKEEY